MQNLANLSNLSGLGVSGGSLFKPNALFRDGEQGVWFDPSDMSTLFQDSLGTTPVTDVEQPVGLMLDKSKGTPTWTNNPAPPGFRVPTSAEWVALVSAEGITNGPTAFASTLKLSYAGYRSRSDGSFANQGSDGHCWSSSVGGSSALRLHFYSSSVNPSSSLARAYGCSVRPIWDGEGIPPSTIIFNGLEYGVVQALDGKYWLDRNLGATRVATAVNDSQSYGWLYQWGRGNDGHQVSTSGTTATLSSTDSPGHGNFILSPNTPYDWRSPQNDMLWKKSGAFQATSAKRPTLSARVNVLVNTDTLLTQNVTTRATTQTLRFEGTGTITLSGTATGTYSAGTHSVVTTAGTLTLTVSGTVSNADLRPSNIGNLPPYQRVGNVGATPSDYNDVGFPKYLRFDGVDDSLQTNSIDFTGTDEMNVFAGVRKESDSLAGVVTELSATTASNNGSFALQAPDANTANTFEYESKGTSLTDSKKTSVVAPLSGVLTGISEISADKNILRVDKAQADSDTGDQGTGNYGNYPLYVGARRGTSLFFNGNLYQLLVRGKLSTDSQITKTEQFISKKTGL